MGTIKHIDWVSDALTDIANVLEAEGAVVSSTHLRTLRSVIELELAEIQMLEPHIDTVQKADAQTDQTPIGRNIVTFKTNTES